jgi:hypothetical protein
MVKLVIKLAIVGLLANAAFQVVPLFYQNWKFTDALKELATYPGKPGLPLTVLQVQEKCERVAKAHDLDLTREDFDVKLPGAGGAKVATIDVSYEVVLKHVPGRPQAHVFTIHVEGEPGRFGSLTP